MAYMAIIVVLLWTFQGSAAADYFISADISAPGSPVPNSWSTLTFWSPAAWQSAVPPGTREHYPYLEFVELFTATGGCNPSFRGCGAYDLDLFVDPTNPGKGYNFTRLLDAIGFILDSGYTPYIVTGNIPVALSTAPFIDVFGFNGALPSNLTAYGEYIGGLAQAAVVRFGIDTVASFRWGVFTEFNNQDWLHATAEEYFGVYDWTACALERALGAANVVIGAHACTQCRSGDDWDPRRLLDHVRSGVSQCTGGAVQMDFITDSFYEVTPGQPGDLSWFLSEVGSLRQYALSIGLDDLLFGIDEGRILSGPEPGHPPLVARAVGNTYQASFDALFFKLMVYNGVSWYSRWGTNSAGSLWAWADAAVDNVASNVAQLSYRMAGDAVIPVTNKTNGGGDSLSIVDAAGSYNVANKTLRILAFHHHPLLDFNGSATVNIQACGLTQANGAVDGVAWNIDDNHAQFWNVWWSDMIANNLTSFVNPGWSIYSDEISIADAKGQAFFMSRVAAYQQLAKLLPAGIQASVSAGCLSFNVTLPNHAVALYEFQAE